MRGFCWDLPNLGIYSLPIAVTIYSLLMCVLNGYHVRKATGYRQEVVRTFLLPAWAALIMGVAAAGIYYGLAFLLPEGYFGNLVSLIAAVAAGALVYFAAALKLGAMTKKELLGIPKGALVVRLRKSCICCNHFVIFLEKAGFFGISGVQSHL